MIRNIALVAHDARKVELIDWVKFNAGSLKECRLFCTGTTGRLVREALEEELGKECPEITCLLLGTAGRRRPNRVDDRRRTGGYARVLLRQPDNAGTPERCHGTRETRLSL